MGSFGKVRPYRAAKKVEVQVEVKAKAKTKE